MAYWLMKSEPGEYSWDDLVAEKRDHWDGVRNYQASNNMKAMKKGDKAFFYHSVKAREIVGIMKIVGEYYPDHTVRIAAGDPYAKAGLFESVEIRAFRCAVGAL